MTRSPPVPFHPRMTLVPVIDDLRSQRQGDGGGDS